MSAYGLANGGNFVPSILVGGLSFLQQPMLRKMRKVMMKARGSHEAVVVAAAEMVPELMKWLVCLSKGTVVYEDQDYCNIIGLVA